MVINKAALKRIKDIHKLSEKYNKNISNNHARRLLELIKEHAEEIELLYNDGDKHYLTETGDLIMLCFELLIEMSVSIDGVMNRCFKRYETKLTKLLQETSG